MPRAGLWQVIQHIGVSTNYFEVVQSMYANVSCMVDMGGVLGGGFMSSRGVKQSCPLRLIQSGAQSQLIVWIRKRQP